MLNSTKLDKLLAEVAHLQYGLLQLKGSILELERQELCSWWWTVKGHPEILMKAESKKATHPACVANSLTKCNVTPTKGPSDEELQRDWQLVYDTKVCKMWTTKEEEEPD